MMSGRNTDFTGSRRREGIIMALMINLFGQKWKLLGCYGICLADL